MAEQLRTGPALCYHGFTGTRKNLCPVLQPSSPPRFPLGGSEGISPRPSTSLVRSFPPRSGDRLAVKKDLCCPLPPVSPLNATVGERRQHFGERSEALTTRERHRVLRGSAGEHCSNPGLMGFVLAREPNLNQTKLRSGFPPFYCPESWSTSY